jgi:hypothetical protein
MTKRPAKTPAALDPFRDRKVFVALMKFSMETDFPDSKDVTAQSAGQYDARLKVLSEKGERFLGISALSLQAYTEDHTSKVDFNAQYVITYDINEADSDVVSIACSVVRTVAWVRFIDMISATQGQIPFGVPRPPLTIKEVHLDEADDS